MKESSTSSSVTKTCRLSFSISNKNLLRPFQVGNPSLVQMRLHAEGLDGDAFFGEAAEHGEDGFTFGLLGGGVGFDVVVVVGENCGGIGFGGGAKGDFEVVFADILQPDGIDHAVGIVVRRIDGFVDDVPGMDAAFIAADEGLDVRGEKRDGVLRGDGRVQPCGIVLVPAEIVAAGGEVLGFGKVHEEIGLQKIETVLFGMRGAPFHLVFGDQDGTLIEEQRGEAWALELRIGNGCAEETSFGVGEFAELGEFGGCGGKRKT